MLRHNGHQVGQQADQNKDNTGKKHIALYGDIVPIIDGGEGVASDSWDGKYALRDHGASQKTAEGIGDISNGGN